MPRRRAVESGSCTSNNGVGTGGLQDTMFWAPRKHTPELPVWGLASVYAKLPGGLFTNGPK